MSDLPNEILRDLLLELRQLQQNRDTYQRDDALEAVIECNREVAEKRLQIKQHCAAHDLPVPPEL
ncbi:MAG: hypothetical protein HKP27_04155 [Myxococcales bacterium]|nr:hypothetical protein [Myxococcales bacterium]